MRRLLLPVAAAALAIAACQGQPANLLTDPNQILAAAADTTASATSVHVDLTADGPIQFDPLGTGAGAGLNIRGTTGAADLDLAGRQLHATFSSPNLMNISGELIVTNDTAYLKSSLTGPNYLSMPIPAPATGSPAPSTQPLAGLAGLLSQGDLKPTKGDDVPCAGGTCYTVTVHLTEDDLAALGAGSGGALASPPALQGIPLPSISGATADLTIHVEQTTNRLSGIDAIVHAGDVGDPHIVLTFTKWNEPVTVTAPPADQVQPAP